jgi:hypothetical protein
MGMDFNQIAMEYVKIYFQCHPEELPKEPEEAFQKMQQMHGKFKHHLIEKQTKKNQDFFSDKL